MEITHERMADELTAWGHRDGWNSLTIAVTEHYFAMENCGALEPFDDDHPRALDNNKQRIQRAFRHDTAEYRAKAKDLMPAVLGAMPATRRAYLEDPQSLKFLASQANLEFAAAMSAIWLGAGIATDRLNRAIEALHALIPITQQLIA